jgi:hypothetical protein
MESTETIFLEMFVYRRFFWCYHFYSDNHEVFHILMKLGIMTQSVNGLFTALSTQDTLHT